MAQPIENLTLSQQADVRGYLGLSSMPFDTSFLNIAVDTILTMQGGVVFINAAAGDVEVTLPAISGTKMQSIIFKRIDTTANAVTVVPDPTDAGGGVEIEAGASISIPKRGGATVRSNTTDWWVTDFTVNNAFGVLPAS